jgi:cell division protein FtsQ
MLRRKRSNRRSSERTLLERLRHVDWKRPVLLVASLVLLGAIGMGFRWLLNEPVGNITVVGQLQHVSAVDVSALARRQIAGHGLASVPVAELRRAIRCVPWVDDVAIERLWPHGLRLHVTEQVAVARWNGAELVNQRGELFGSGTAQLPPDLPALQGPEGRIDEVFSRYLQARASLAAAGAYLRAMAVDARGAWELRLDGDITVRLGRGDVDARFQRLLDAAWPVAAARASEVNYIDMRYTNGFAISWKRGATRLASNGARGAGKANG